MNNTLAAAVLAIGAAGAPLAQAQDTSPTGLVDALNGTFGSHAGMRASHAKGFCAVGQFQPAKSARDFADGPLFGQQSVPANVRFSVGGGNPKASDKSRSVRGLSMRVASGGETWDLLLISEPAFFAATPESFVSFLQARVHDPATGKPDPRRRSPPTMPPIRTARASRPCWPRMRRRARTPARPTSRTTPSCSAAAARRRSMRASSPNRSARCSS